MRAFAHALQLDESYFDQHGDASSPQIPGTPVQNHASHTRIRKVSALSDFAPINLKIKRCVDLQVTVLFSMLRPMIPGAAEKRNIKTNEVTIFSCFCVGRY